MSIPVAMQEAAAHSSLLFCMLTAAMSAVTSLVPVSPGEPLLVAAAAMAPAWLLLPLAASATLGHMVAKTVVFLGARKAGHLVAARHRATAERWRGRLDGRPALRRAALLASAFVGLPPFYVVTTLCGALRMPLREYVVIAGTGRGLRLLSLVLVPQLFVPTAGAQPAPARAVHPARAALASPPPVVVAGEGRETVVLVAGLVGGVAGFGRLQERLVARGFRVVAVDPYNLSIDSTDVSFASLARRVDDVLRAHGVVAARVVGHSHGGGVVLRLAAQSPARVASVHLLDVGAQPDAQGPMFGAALRLVPLVAAMPGGKRFLRDRFVRGLEETSGDPAWLDDATRDAYVRPVLAHIGRAVDLARRVAAAREPEPVAQVLARVRAPVTVLLGAVPHPSRPTAYEMENLHRLPTPARVLRLPGVGHFPHEEAPDAVADQLVRPSPLLATRAP